MVRWHTSRWQDFANTLIDTSRQQVFDQQWLARIKVARIDVGTGMTREECTRFNQAVDVLGLRAYWEAVGNAVREVARPVPAEDLIKPVDTARLYRMLDDGTIDERAGGCPLSLREEQGLVPIYGDLAHSGAPAWGRSLREASVRDSARSISTGDGEKQSCLT